MACWWICCLVAVHLASGVRSIDDCGIRKFVKHEQGHNAKQASPAEWPWHAGIFYWVNATNLRYACGGSIIARNFILTAGHCTYLDKDHGVGFKLLLSPHSEDLHPAESSSLLVQVGMTNLHKLDHSLQQHSVAEIIRHGQRNEGGEPNGIALLKLTKELQITDYVRPICLWRESESQNKKLKKEAYIAGWGLDENSDISNQLEQQVIPDSNISHTVCTLDAEFTDDMSTAGTYCATFSNDTTLGIGWNGGGVYIEVDGHWMLRGIIIQVQTVVTNFNLKSGTWSNTTNVVNFIEVGYNINWIQRHIEI